MFDHIRSFSGRKGHFTGGQRLAHETLLPQFGIRYEPRLLDLAGAFGRTAPVIMEIGFGMGDATAIVAQRNPHLDFLGVEVYPAGVGSLLRQIAQLGLTNVRIIEHDAFEVVRDMIAPRSLAGVHIFFPDPWPKARHHKRRLVQPPFVAMLAQRLADRGTLHCATDWAPYAEQMLAVLEAEPLLVNTVSGYAPRPELRPLTKFEHKGLARGHVVSDLVFERRAEAPPA